MTAKPLGAREGRLLKTPLTYMVGILFARNQSTMFLLPLKTSDSKGRCGSHINKKCLLLRGCLVNYHEGVLRQRSEMILCPISH